MKLNFSTSIESAQGVMTNCLGTILLFMFFAGTSFAQSTITSELNSSHTKAGVEMLSKEQANSVISQALKTPIPSDYQVPSYITQGNTVEKVMENFSARYPEFYGKRGNSYVQAVQLNPKKFKQMIIENKAIRAEYSKK